MTTWVKLLDNFPENAKVLAAGEDASWLYVLGLLYCSRNLTDGSIPRAALPKITAKRAAPALAGALVREGLWSETDTGWQVHDYLKVQRSREQVESVRGQGVERAKRSRETRAQQKRTEGERSPMLRATEAVAVTETEPSLVPPVTFDHPATPKIEPEDLANGQTGLGALKQQYPQLVKGQSA